MKAKISFIIILFSVFVSFESQAQYWEWAKGASMASGFCESGFSAVDSKGNVYGIGRCSSPVIYFDNDSVINNSNSLTFLVKYDSIGNVIWALGSQGSAGVEFDRIVIDGSDNIYICGILMPGSAVFGSDTLINSTIDREFFLIKFDSDGNEKWMRNAIGYSQGLSLDLDSHANVFVTGYFACQSISIGGTTLNNSTSNSYNSEIIIAKYDSSGNFQFGKTIIGDDGELSFGLSVDNTDNFYVTGLCQGFTTQMTFDSITIPIINRDLFLAKYNGNGNCIWARSASGETDIVNLAVDNHCNIYLTGATPSYLIFGIDTVNNYGTGFYPETYFLVKYDSTGQEIWAKHSVGGGTCMGFSITPDNNNHLYVQGGFSMNDSVSVTFDSLTLSYPGGVDPLFLLTYDFDGNILCSETLQSGGDDWAQIAIGHGFIYMCGDFIQNANGDPFVIGNDSLYGAGSNSENFFIAKYHSCFEEEPNIVSSITTENNFMLIPNPASDQITISNSTSEITNWQIINLLGEVIKENKTINSVNTISISIKDLPNGIYFMRAQTTDEFISKKFVKG